MKILAVDDDENIRELLSVSVSSETPHEIVTAASGPEALRIVSAAADPFDCFLLDIQMPIMNGITLCEKLRKTRGHSRVPIIMLTAMSQKKYIDAAFKAGATDYVTKPFEFLELFSRLSNAQRLSTEQHCSKEGRTEVVELKKDLERSFDHSLSEPIEIPGIECVVGYVSFENYIMQLSRAKALRSSVFAVKILNVDKAHREMSRVGFQGLVKDVARILAGALKGVESLITYRGNGIFLCAQASRHYPDPYAFEMTLNNKVAETAANRVADQNIRLCLGDKVSLMSLTKAGAMFSLQTAAANAENRGSDKKEVLHAMNRIIRARNRSAVYSDMERRAYEVLLRDSARDTAKKGWIGAATDFVRMR